MAILLEDLKLPWYRYMKEKSPHEPIIYLIINQINGKVYVGKTVDQKRRWAEHTSNKDLWIDRSIRKHGVENFDFNIIEQYGLESELSEAEIWWIAYLKSIGAVLYNQTEGGDGISGYQHTEETKKLMSDKRKALFASGYTTKHTEKTRKQMSQSAMGHKRSLGKKHKPDCGHCKLLRERNANNNPAKNGVSENTRRKMSDKKKGSKNNYAKMTEEKVIELRQLSAEGTSIPDLVKKFGIAPNTIRGIIKRQSWKHIP